MYWLLIIMNFSGLIARLHPEAQWGVPWSPLESMNNTDADVALNFVTFNNVRYSNPVDDPFFSAHQTRLVGPEGQQSVSYRSDNVARVMGCAVQVRCSSDAQQVISNVERFNTAPPSQREIRFAVR